MGKIFTKDFVLLFAANLIVVSVYFLLITTMAAYAADQYGVSGGVAGLAASVFMIGGVTGRVLGARYAATVGYRRLTLVVAAVMLAACLLYFASVVSIVFLLVVRFVHGVTFGVANTTLPALAVEGIPAKRMGEGTGYFMLSNSLGTGIGPLMGLVVAVGIDYQVLFALCSVLAAVAVAIAWVMARTGRDVLAPRPAGPFRLDSVIDAKTWRFSAFMLLVGIAFSGYNAFLNGFAASLDLAVFAPFAFLVYSVCLLLTRPFAGKLMDRRGENAVLYPSFACLAAGLALTGCSTNPVMLLATGFFMAAGFGVAMSAGQAAATRMVHGGNTARTISTFFLFCDGGVGIGPFLLGFIVSAAGYRPMFFAAAACSLAALLLYHVVHGRTSARRSAS